MVLPFTQRFFLISNELEIFKIFFCLDCAKPGWISPDGSGSCRIQDEAECPGPGHLVEHPQLLLQRLVEYTCLQTHARLPQIRLFPGKFLLFNKTS